MIFGEPIPFEEAIQHNAVKSLLPTTAGSAALSELPASILERAWVSARVDNAYYLQRIADVTQMLADPAGAAAQAAGGIGHSKAAQILRDALQEIGYHPGTAGVVPGSIQDFSSEARINLVLETNRDMALGYGQHAQGQDRGVLDAFPCQELYRELERKEKRPWPQIWRDAGGETYGGRMIARKDSPIWVAISEFHLSYPPFAYNSGMWVRDVARSECIRLGVKGLETPVEPRDRGLNETFKLSPPDRHRDLLTQLMTDMGDRARLVDGKLILKRKAA